MESFECISCFEVRNYIRYDRDACARIANTYCEYFIYFPFDVGNMNDFDRD